MSTRTTWALLAAALTITAACSDKGDDTGDDGTSDGGSADGGSGDGGSGDGGSGDGGSGDGGSDELTHTYTVYDGWESFDFNNGSYGAGDYNCQLVWRLSGTPVSPYSSDCDNCEFVFDVEYTVDNEFTYDDGTCDGYGLIDHAPGTYAYSSDFDGYGPAWVFNYYGYYYWWGTGSFDGSVFNYTYGYTDYPYNGLYYSYYQYGLIDVQ
jgi:hypothetical protein